MRRAKLIALIDERIALEGRARAKLANDLMIDREFAQAIDDLLCAGQEAQASTRLLAELLRRHPKGFRALLRKLLARFSRRSA